MTMLNGPIVNGTHGQKLEKPVVQQWFADQGDATLRLDYPLTEESVVLDVGGYEGAWAALIRQRYLCKVHIFEPVPAFAENIRRRFANDPAVHVHSFGLSDHTGSADITLSADGSSVHKTSESRCTIHLRQAAEIFAELSLSHIALIKINIEGCEYELLEHLAAAGLLPRIENIQVQFHDFVEGAAARMTHVQSLLAATHALTWQYRFVWENWRRTVTGSE
jgi:FkbM family methyltransferase